MLMTGAAGNVGGWMEERLRDRYDLALIGHTDAVSPFGTAIPGADLAELDALVEMFTGIDSVIHLAGSASPESSWEQVLHNNMIGTRNVLEAARLAGVRRVVFASTNHVMGGYDRMGEWPIYVTQSPRADSLYGVSKAFGETLGRFYHDEYGLDFIAIRIGWVTQRPDGDELLRAFWLSPDDCAQVLACAIEAPARYGIYYATSANPNRRWDLLPTMVELGYRPRDSWTDALGLDEIPVPGGEPAPEKWPNG